MQDRTTQVLLALIAIALWGLLLRPSFSPAPAEAQGKASLITLLDITDKSKAPAAVRTFPIPSNVQLHGFAISPDGHRYILAQERK